MQHTYYLLALITSLAGLVAIDWRFKIAIYKDWRRALKTLGLSAIVLFAWDIVAIVFGIFFHGNSAYSLSLFILPQIPIEEILFLLLLCYIILLVSLEVTRWRRT